MTVYGKVMALVTKRRDAKIEKLRIKLASAERFLVKRSVYASRSAGKSHHRDILRQCRSANERVQLLRRRIVKLDPMAFGGASEPIPHQEKDGQ